MDNKESVPLAKTELIETQSCENFTNQSSQWLLKNSQSDVLEAWRNCQSVTMLGLAISIGTAGVLMPCSQQKALATNLEWVNLQATASSFLSTNNYFASLPSQDIGAFGDDRLNLLTRSQTSKINNPNLRQSTQNLSTSSLRLKSSIQAINSAQDNLEQRQRNALEKLTEKKQKLQDILRQLKADNVNTDVSSAALTRQRLVLLDRQVDAILQRASLESASFSILKSSIQLQSNERELIKNSTLTSKLLTQIQASNPVLLAKLPIHIYEVKSGDNLNKIARHYQVSVAEIVKLNRIKNPNAIAVKDRLTIPIAAKKQSFENNTNVIGKSSTTIATTQQNSLKVSIAPQVSVDNNPYIDNLKADIIKLQQEYKGNQKIDRTASNGNKTLNESLANNPQTLNLNWIEQSKKDRAALANQPQQNLVSQALLGVAPTSAIDYNQKLKTPMGTILPNLPPLSSPEQYLPNSSGQFNGYIWPAKGTLTSGYGWRWGRMHKGIDIAAPIGTPVYAAASGKVISAGWSSGGYGNLIKIQHADGSLTYYAHNSKILVRTGQIVEQSQQIADMGNTGFSTGPHLHFEIHPSGSGATNPIALLPKK